jgi:hypothetical protein
MNNITEMFIDISLLKLFLVAFDMISRGSRFANYRRNGGPARVHRDSAQIMYNYGCEMEVHIRDN